ncbi:MAG: UDP-2,3-diacylglucosamine diphosphatase, partial [Xanthobacteraceae bacterium]|nr:UDP-2,3-diacylglucosamine diphosphatase [Xanthobacteraceae bacterium]
HIHHATIHDLYGTRYMNCGDWVESCTALAEHYDGTFELLTWTIPEGNLLPARAAPAGVPVAA